jgi:hypothetical protein
MARVWSAGVAGSLDRQDRLVWRDRPWWLYAGSDVAGVKLWQLNACGEDEELTRRRGRGRRRDSWILRWWKRCWIVYQNTWFKDALLHKVYKIPDLRMLYCTKYIVVVTLDLNMLYCRRCFGWYAPECKVHMEREQAVWHRRARTIFLMLMLS